MSSLFLQYLPREIRDSIYQHVFTYSTGIIFLYPDSAMNGRHNLVVGSSNERYDAGQYVRSGTDLALLLTCKQVYTEARHLVWKYNTLSLLPWQLYIDLPYFCHVQHVQLEVYMTSRRALNPTRHALKTLVQYAKDGCLKTLTLRPVGNTEVMEELAAVYKHGEPYRFLNGKWNDRGGEKLVNEYLKILKEARKDCLSQATVLKKKVVIYVGWNDRRIFGPERQCYWIQELKARYILDKIHAAFGGELWQDETLCWKDHVKIEETFK